MEFVPGGDLLDYITEKKKIRALDKLAANLFFYVLTSHTEEAEVQHITRELCKAIAVRLITVITTTMN